MILLLFLVFGIALSSVRTPTNEKIIIINGILSNPQITLPQMRDLIDREIPTSQVGDDGIQEIFNSIASLTRVPFWLHSRIQTLLIDDVSPTVTDAAVDFVMRDMPLFAHARYRDREGLKKIIYFWFHHCVNPSLKWPKGVYCHASTTPGLWELSRNQLDMALTLEAINEVNRLTNTHTRI